MEQKKKTGKAKVLIGVVIVLALAAGIVYFLFFHRGAENNKNDASGDTKETVAATEFVITPCDKEDEELFIKALPGSWSSYTAEGKLYTYTFEEDGSVRYKKDGENAVDFTYTFSDGLLTIKGSDKDFVYQCSKDAVGMMAKLHNGEWQSVFAKAGETIPDFNGCIYIVDDVMYMGSVCLCNDSTLDEYEGTSLEGEWLGVKGDTIKFNADGSYNYVENAESYYGSYVYDEDKHELSLTLGETTTKYTDSMWGLEGRFFNIGMKYYFKLTK